MMRWLQSALMVRRPLSPPSSAAMFFGQNRVFGQSSSASASFGTLARPSSSILWPQLNSTTPSTSIMPMMPMTPLAAMIGRQQLRYFRVRSSIKKQCEHCYVRRKKNKKWYVYCKANPRHKQRQL